MNWLLVVVILLAFFAGFVWPYFFYTGRLHFSLFLMWIGFVLLLWERWRKEKISQKRNSKLAQIKELCEKQRALAESTDPVDIILLGAVVNRVVISTEEIDPADLKLLVNFCCRFPVSYQINAETPREIVYGSQKLLGTDLYDVTRELLEYKNRIGGFFFWRTAGRVFFRKSENDKATLPFFCIGFDITTLDPKDFFVSDSNGSLRLLWPRNSREQS